MRFFFKATNQQGLTITGEREAKDKFDLAHELVKEGLSVFAVHTQAVGSTASRLQYWNERVIRIKLRDKITFATNLSAMLSAGLSLSRALGVILKQTKNVRFHRIIEAILRDVDAGSSLHDALHKYTDIFPPVFIGMVEAGEQSGNLPNALTIVGEQLSKAYALQKKIKGAMVYPAVILCIMAAIGVLMLIYVVPTLTETFSQMGNTLPASTQFILGLSSFASNHLVGLLVGLILIFGILALVLRTPPGRRMAHWCILHMPLIGGLAKQTNTATTARTLSALISSGVDMVQALALTAHVLQNSYFKQVVDEAGKTVQKGEPLAAVFERHDTLYPILMGEMVEVGEETGKLSEMLMKVALFYEEEVSQATKDLSTIIEPLLMVLIGSGVGFFAIAMIQPIYSIGNSI